MRTHSLRSLGGATPEEIRVLSEKGSKIAYLTVRMIRECSPLFDGFGLAVSDRKGHLSLRLRWRLAPAGKKLFPEAVGALGGANLLEGDRFVTGFLAPIAQSLKRSIPARGLFRRPFAEFSKYYRWAGFFAHSLLISGFWPDMLRYDGVLTLLGLVPLYTKKLGLRTGRVAVSDRELTLSFQ